MRDLDSSDHHHHHLQYSIMPGPSTYLTILMRVSAPLKGAQQVILYTVYARHPPTFMIYLAAPSTSHRLSITTYSIYLLLEEAWVNTRFNKITFCLVYLWAVQSFSSVSWRFAVEPILGLDQAIFLYNS